MRLYLLPISTRRSFLYAQRLHGATADVSYVDRGAVWAARKWSEWEKKESGWQRKVVEYGNHAFRRIPYEEWGLKSVPPLGREPRRAGPDEGSLQGGEDAVELVFPRSVMSEAQAEEVVRRMGGERKGLHRRRLLWCFAGMPATLPFALVPIVPNLPFFYLVYRAWSHWRAIAGGKHIKSLGDRKLLRPTSSPVLDALYGQAGTLQQEPGAGLAPNPREVLLLTQAQARTFAEKLGLPALEVELERAIWQVQQVIEQDAQKGEEEERQKAKVSDKEKIS